MNHNINDRPNPDEILASLISEEEKSRRGKLKIFFGMCAGVGKTYTMLQTARSEKAKGTDIVAGYVETHNRRETSELLSGFELIPRKTLKYRSAEIQEMDLDAILVRKPHTVIVDELAHSNAPGSRHLKRYQDVQELLEYGINVFTTLNVQHLESRSETVAQITGIVVRETVPDEIFENADEVELIDITPDELLLRFSEGKVYAPEGSRRAVNNFFRLGNITALREMALRIVADRVDRQLHDYMKDKRIRGPWKSGIHLLVAIGYSPYSANLLRWAKNLSYTMGAQIQAIYVESTQKLTPRDREQLDNNIKLAKRLGIKVNITTNNEVVPAIVDYAQKENVTHIVVGKPRGRSLLSHFRAARFINRLVRFSGNIDVYIIGADPKVRDGYRRRVSIPSFTSGFREYFIVSLLIIIASSLCYPLREVIGYQAVSFVLLFLVSILAIFFGTGPVLLAAILSAVIWDLFFIPPQFTLYIENPIDILLLIMFFIIALLNGVLTSRTRRQEKRIRIREERTNALYQLTRDLSAISGIDQVTLVASEYIRKYFHLDSHIFIRNNTGTIDLMSDSNTDTIFTGNEKSIADWVFRNSLKAGRFTDTLPSGEYTFFPLTGNNSTIGVIGIKPAGVFTHGEEQFWEAFLAQITGKYEREMLREAAKKTLVISESEKLYKTLFDSLSHELRTPVAAILGASDALLANDFTQGIQRQLHDEINTASIRLNRLIGNLLSMSRIESGLITPRPDWTDVHDLARSVTDQLRNELKPFQTEVIIPAGMPLVRIDYGLMEQAIYNLVLNATQHSPEGSRIRIKFFIDNGILVIQVMDRGPGFPPDELESAFMKFFRGRGTAAGGSGLGLSIVKGFTEAQKGSVSVENRKNGGALFTIKLPVEISDIGSIYVMPPETD
ncbi:MAG: sensor histidine kinase KdpD [Bacteroidales bacterium]|jgi:two-component system sensor histidine kinase KdpD|nr:sensor histidine kinase KdpD [Bacteroidales bacterium]